MAESSTYRGSFKNEEKHGYGKLYNDEGIGNYFKGLWVNDKKKGRGTLKLANGDKYDGCWENSKKHGYGEFLSADGEIYNGAWKEGKKHGYG